MNLEESDIFWRLTRFCVKFSDEVGCLPPLVFVWLQSGNQHALLTKKRMLCLLEMCHISMQHACLYPPRMLVTIVLSHRHIFLIWPPKVEKYSLLIDSNLLTLFSGNTTVSNISLVLLHSDELQMFNDLIACPGLTVLSVVIFWVLFWTLVLFAALAGMILVPFSCFTSHFCQSSLLIREFYSVKV